MTTITEQLEGLLPADGPMTKDQRIIAEAVGELRRGQLASAVAKQDADYHLNRWLEARRSITALVALAFASGIALAVVVGVVV